MDYLLVVQKVDSEADLDENAPDQVFRKEFVVLFLNETFEIAMLAELHDDIDVFVYDE